MRKEGTPCTYRYISHVGHFLCFDCRFQVLLFWMRREEVFLRHNCQNFTAMHLLTAEMSAASRYCHNYTWLAASPDEVEN